MRLGQLRAPQESEDCKDQEYDEQHLRDTGSAGCNPAESKNGSNYGDNKKHDRVMKHERSPVIVGFVACLLEDRPHA